MTEKSLAEIIDESLGIRGPEDLIRLVLLGVGIAILTVGWFMTKLQIFSTEWNALAGFQIIATLLCVTSIYVVYVLIPQYPKESIKVD